MKIINLTPHPITICDKNGETKRVINSDGIARLKATTVIIGSIDGIPISKTEYGNVDGLPDENNKSKCPDENGKDTPCIPDLDNQCIYCGQSCMDDKRYIVSQLIKAAYPNRCDLLVPAEIVRDANGNILGCQTLGI